MIDATRTLNRALTHQNATPCPKDPTRRSPNGRAAVREPTMTSGGDAPHCPASTARWAPAEKDVVATAVAGVSRVWLTMASGILTEVFHPGPDEACIRALRLLVTGGGGFFSDEATDAQHASPPSAASVPVVRTVSTCLEGRYRIEKETVCDPRADVVLQRVRFTPETPGLAPLRLFAFLEPHLGDDGNETQAEVGEHKGMSMLFASRPDGRALALACSAPWLAASAGVVGTSDGKRDLQKHGHLVDTQDHASGGPVALTGEIAHETGSGSFTLALGFGRTKAEAAHASLGSLMRGFDAAHALYVGAWEAWGARLRPCRVGDAVPRLWRRSVTVLKTLESKRDGGGRVAALSTPWGASKGPGIDGTYHLVWTRDLVECLGALLAAGAHGEVRSALSFLRSTQEADGHWPQNMRLSGEAFWDNDELDEVALPIVFLHLVEREGILTSAEKAESWTMTRLAAGFLARRGPSTVRDRWEDVGGMTPFTLASEVVALLIAARLAEENAEPTMAGYLRDLADEWNERIDSALYRRGGALAELAGVDGYYVRVRKPGEGFARDLDVHSLPATELSPDALALVRFGLRAADDPRIVDTVRVIDAVLKTELPGGPSWRRYPGDKYGEHADGAPFDGDGIGRPWPLLTGERAHYELECGRVDRAQALLATMESFASASGMLPEQVWDQDDVPPRGLVRGAPTGSAAPLGWAHAEYVKLCRSLEDGVVFDMPRHVKERYGAGRERARRIRTWRVGDPAPRVAAGEILRVALDAAGTVEWTHDGWRSCASTRTTDAGVGVFFADVAPAEGKDLTLRVRFDGTRGTDPCEVSFGGGRA
jgi:glucoamylase